MHHAPNQTAAYIDYLISALLGEKHTTLSAFEDALHARLMELGREVLRVLLERLDDVVSQAALTSGRREKAKHGHRIISRFGAFRYHRMMVQSARNGAVHSPLAEHLNLPLGFVTPSAARLSLRTAAGLSTRAATKLLQAFGGAAPSRTTLMKLLAEFGDGVQARRDEVLRLLSDSAAPPENAVAVSVQLDGVMALLVSDRRDMLKQVARDEGRKAGGPLGAAECSVGALVYLDVDGNRLSTVRVARMPEPGKAGLKEDLRTLLHQALEKRPDLTVVALSDGAPNHWTFLESLEPDYQLVDYFHTAEHIQRRLNRALGVGTHATQAASKKLRKRLLQPNGHAAVFAELEEIERRKGTLKPRKKKGRGAQPNFYERHHHRMTYAELVDRNLPIGSGAIEGTARHIVVDRLRQTGMRWKHPGGQAVLDLRCAVVNGIYDLLWAMLHPESHVLSPLSPT